MIKFSGFKCCYFETFSVRGFAFLHSFLIYVIFYSLTLSIVVRQQQPFALRVAETGDTYQYDEMKEFS